jgi:hypothetical protein
MRSNPARRGRRFGVAIHSSPRSALLLLCGMLCLSSCTGEVADVGNQATAGSGPASGVGGSQTAAGGAKSTGQGGAGPAAAGGNPAPGGGQASAGQAGSGGPVEDPYAIPASPPAPVLVPTPRLARLSRKQWSNTVRDLLKLPDISEIDKGISGDALVRFDNEADKLFVGEMLRQELATAAELLAERVISDSAALARLVPAGAPADAAGRARSFIASFGQRAFRRPLAEEEITTHLGLFNKGPTLYPGVDAFNAGINLVIQAMLQSPHFLYRTELVPAPAGAQKVPLNDYEVASKLAFAITNTMPDDELFAAAAAGQLQDRTNVVTQVKRLLDGPKGADGLANFQMQVFRLGTYDGITRDPAIFPDFTTSTPAAMRTEVLMFLDWIFKQGRGIKDVYTSPVGFVNSALAPLYGLTGNFSADTFTKVDLDPTQRSGLLTQPGFLSSYITGEDPDIIHRGVFIAQRVLCVELPPPDPNATPLPAFEPNMTNRERVEKTTGKGTCGEGCHAHLLNPLGYAFEGYDAIGKYRTVDHGKPVDAASSAFLDGKSMPFANGVELSRLLAEAKQTHDCYAQKLLNYVHGRWPVAPEEKPTVDYLARLSRAGMLSLRDLEVALVTHDAFLNRLP